MSNWDPNNLFDIQEEEEIINVSPPENGEEETENIQNDKETEVSEIQETTIIEDVKSDANILLNELFEDLNKQDKKENSIIQPSTPIEFISDVLCNFLLSKIFVYLFFGANLFLTPIPTILAMILWFFTVKITKLSSLGALLSIFLLTIYQLIFIYGNLEKGIVFIIFLLIFFKHSSNIKRLIKGEENKINL